MDRMTEVEYAKYIRARDQQMLSSHWPRATALLAEGHTPNEVAARMTAEGYWGRSSRQFDVDDLRYLSERVAESEASQDA